MNIADLKIGQIIHLSHQRRFDYAGESRIEFVAADWIVVRVNDLPVFLNQGDVEYLDTNWGNKDDDPN